MKKENLYLIGTLLIVFIFYAHTLNYPWRDFDENIIYKELILPMPRSLNEFIRYINEFGLMVYFEASNPFYSSVGNLRVNPVGVFLTMLVQMCFQKNPFLYHSLSLFLHMVNSALLFLCLKKVVCKN